MWIFAVGAVLHINLVNAILYQNIELPKATPLPIPGINYWDSLNAPILSPYDNNLVTSNDLSKLTAYGTTYFHPQTLATVYGTVKSPNDVIDEYGYYHHDGRFLKQYFVAEENIDDINALNSFLSRFMPYVPHNYNVPASKLPNLGFPTIAPPPSAPPIQNNPLNGYYSFPRIPAVPVQLGGSQVQTNSNK